MSEPRTKTGKAEEIDPSAAGEPPAGPHDKPELTNDDATPGAGALPSNDKGGDAEEGTS